MTDRRWNLGKETPPPPRPEKKAAVEPEKPAPPRPEPPLRRKPAAEDLPKQPPPPGRLLDSTEAEKIRPVSNSKNWKEIANHPVTLVSIGAAVCLFWIIYAIVRITSPSVPAARPSDAVKTVPSSGVVVEGATTTAMQDKNIVTIVNAFEQPVTIEMPGGARVDIPELEPRAKRDGRVLAVIAAMLQATANAIQNGTEGEIEYDLKLVWDAPLPEHDAFIYNIAIDRQGVAVEHLQSVAQGIAKNKTDTQNLTTLSNVLMLEARALLLNDAAARSQLQSMRSRLSGEQVNDLIREIIPAPLSEQLITIRHRNAFVS